MSWERWGTAIARLILGAAVLMPFLLASPAFAAGPRELVKQTLEAVSAVASEPQLQGAEREGERRQKVGTIIRETFDFDVMARESLRSHWTELTPAQHEEFVRLFGNLFQRSYDRLVLRFLGESKTAYGDESLDKDRAVVRTTLVRKQESELPVDYHLTYDGKRWAMSNVVVDGVSLLANFRAQFDKTIRTSSYEALLDKIKAKLEREQSP